MHGWILTASILCLQFIGLVCALLGWQSATTGNWAYPLLATLCALAMFREIALQRQIDQHCRNGQSARIESQQNLAVRDDAISQIDRSTENVFDLAERVLGDQHHHIDDLIHQGRRLGQDVDTAHSAFNDTSSSIGNIGDMLASVRAALSEMHHKWQELADGRHADEQARVLVEQTVTSLQADATQAHSSLMEVEEVATRINRLAINAQIEAARAGDFGKGFDVVAQEVKALAAETRAIAETIGSSLSGVSDKGRAIQTAQAEMGAIADRLAQANQDMDATIETQIAKVEEAEPYAQAITNDAKSGRERMELANCGIRELIEAGGQLAGQANEVDSFLGIIRRELKMLIAESAHGGRRQHVRYDMDVSATIVSGGQSLPCMIADLSFGGCRLAHPIAVSANGKIAISIGELDLECVTADDANAVQRLQFVGLDGHGVLLLTAILEQAEEHKPATFKATERSAQKSGLANVNEAVA